MSYYHSLLALREELDVADCMRFIFESGPDPEKPFSIDEQIVGDLYRVSDVMFMPSHREGFGMPVIEAGLVGIPIVSRSIPAAKELAKHEAAIFKSYTTPSRVAYRMLQTLNRSQTANLRRRVRREYTWQAIINNDILPLLQTRIEN
jgi:glycosyltransferase involved in cell wall biosynthesis